MPNIDKEINDFRNAELGEEVRGSLITLAQKLNEVVEQGVDQVASLQQSIATANSKIQSLQTLFEDAQDLVDHVDQNAAANVVPDVTAQETAE